MKKILLIPAAVLCMLAAFSCEKEAKNPEEETGKVTTTISVSLPEASMVPAWKAGDKVLVNGVTSEALDSKAAGKKTGSFVFPGQLGTPHYAAYPVSAFSDYQAGSATVTLPSSQKYVAGSYDPAAFVMGAKSTERGKAALTPLVSLIHLNITGSASVSKIKVSGAEGAALSGAFTTNFVKLTGNSASRIVELNPTEAVALPAEFFICVPAGLKGDLTINVFDADGGAMGMEETIQTNLVAGGVHDVPAFEYEPSGATYDIEISAEGITSSTAVICWDNAYTAAYTISVFSDAACATLVDSYAVDAGNACWGEKSPRFCISGLAPGTPYYVKVDNEAQDMHSNVLEITTSEFTVVEASSTAAAVGDVILAEDFGELRWDCDLIGNGAGWFPTEAAQASFSTVEVDSFQAAATSNEKRVSAQAEAVAHSRLAHWAQGENPHMYVHPGYLKLVGEKKVTHIVTPALESIPEGKIATVEVELTASAYYSASSGSFCTTSAIVAVQTGSLNEMTAETKTNTLNLSTNVAPVTLKEESAWNTYKVTLNGVRKGNRIAFGAAGDVSGNDARMNLSDIKVTIKALEDAPAATITASLKSVSSSAAAFAWTFGNDAPGEDTAAPYTAAIYSDSGCNNLVVSHDFEASESCWGSKSPCFSFGGLAPASTYYFRVTDTAGNITSNVVEVTTAAFTPVDASKVSNAAVGDVILAEDFSEIGWGPDEFAVAAGFIPSPKNLVAPSGVNPDGSYTVFDNTGQRIFGTGVDLGDSRLSHGWGFHGNSSTYLRNAYLRVGASGGRTHMVTPALAGIPEGKQATIEVKVTATKYDEGMQIAAFAEKGLTQNETTDTGDGVNYKKYTGASLSKGSAFDISTVKEWDTKTVTLTGVDSECQLLIGSLENNDGKNRFYFKNVVVTIVALKEAGAMDQVVEINDFDSFKAFLSAVEPGKSVQGNLNADITLTSEQLADIDALYPVAEFEGIVNGNGHTIAGLTKPLFGTFTGKASNLTLNSTINISEAWDEAGIFAKRAENATITGCVSMGSITHASATPIDGELALGGLIGSISGSTLTACHNLANVTNTTTATEFVRMGGLIGVADGANTLTGTSEAFNYNKSIVLEHSASEKVAVGGVCGYTFGEASDFAYAQNQIQDGDDVDDITIQDNTRDKVYAGGIIGMSANTSSFDYASNIDADVCFQDLTMSETGQVFAGGIIGGWSESGEQTITGCSNSGWIYTKKHADSDKYYGDIGVGGTPTPLWSCFGGIAGMGSGTSEGLNGGVATITGKTFHNCSMSGRILIYCMVRCCIGGVVAYTENDPVGCVCTNNIRLYKNGGIKTVGDNYHRQIVGGVVGYCKASSATNLKYDGTILTQSSSPFAYTGGIIGYLHTSEIELNNCRVGGSIRATGDGGIGSSAVMCHNNTNEVSVTFTNCKIKKGTISYATGSKATINSDSDVTEKHCFGGASKYTVVGDVLPSVAESID